MLVPPSLFWEAGFDTFCVDAEREALASAQQQYGEVVEFSLGQPDDLPFEDDVFDYAVLPALPASSLRQSSLSGRWQKFIEEAVRVSAFGVVLISGNPLHPAFWRHGRDCLVPWKLWLSARRAAPHARITLRSSIPVPFRAAQKRPEQQHAVRPSLYQSGTCQLFLPLGAVYGLRLGWDPVSGTPVGALRLPSLPDLGKEAVMNSSLTTSGTATAEVRSEVKDKEVF